MGLGHPERDRGGQEEASDARQHGDPHRANRSLDAPDDARRRGRSVPPPAAGDPEPQHRRADVDPLPDLELARSGEPLVIEEGAVLAPEVLEEQPLAPPGEPGVAPADRGVREAQVAAARAAEDERPLGDGEQLARARTVLGVEEDLLVRHPDDRRDHRRRSDGVPARAALAASAHRIRRHPLGRRIVGVEGGGLALVERELARVLGVLRAVVRGRTSWGSLGVRWRHAGFARALIPRPCNDVTFLNSTPHSRVRFPQLPFADRLQHAHPSQGTARATPAR